MSDIRGCPYCEGHEVYEDGTFTTYSLVWEGYRKGAEKHRAMPQFLSDEHHKRLIALRTKYPGRFERIPEPDPEHDPMAEPWECGYIHKSTAENDYRMYQRILQDNMLWQRNKDRLKIVETRTSWDEVFGPDAVWMA